VIGREAFEEWSEHMAGYPVYEWEVVCSTEVEKKLVAALEELAAVEPYHFIVMARGDVLPECIYFRPL
jgi:hypothetical protein